MNDIAMLGVDSAKWIESCEQEKLHLSGAIQAHGALFVVNSQGDITHVSANIADFYQMAECVDAPAWLGGPLSTVLQAGLHRLGAAPGQRLSLIGACEGRTGALDVVYSRQAGGGAVVELTYSGNTDTPSLLAHIPMEPPPDNAQQLHAAQLALVEEVLAITGFERVVYHHFTADGDGEVICERTAPQVSGSYLGLRFPATDVPAVARTLYLKNPWRLISDAKSANIRVIYNEKAHQLPDLTYSDLRSASPVHCIYMGNMGVRASLSFPITVGGELRALVVAHHSEARTLPLHTLEQLSARVRAHTLAYSCYSSRRSIRLMDGLSVRFSPFIDALHRHGELESAWMEYAPQLLEEFGADGAVLCRADKVIPFGHSLEPDALAVLDDWFVRQGSEFVWMCDSLSRRLPEYPLSATAGVLAIRTSTLQGLKGLRLYLTRQEHIHEVAWGGNPNKPEEVSSLLGVAPRRSFEKWVEKRLGYSRPWLHEHRLLALKLRELLQQADRS